MGGFVADYVYNLTLSRFLSPTGYGDFKVAYAFAFIASVVVVLGGDRAAPKFLSEALARAENGPVWEYLRFYGLLSLGLSALVIAGTVGYGILHSGPNDLHEHHPIVPISFVVPILAIGALLARLLQAAKRPGSAVLPWRVALPLMQVTAIVGLALFDVPITLHEVIVIALVVPALITAWLWDRARGLGLIALQRRPDLLQGRKTLSASIPMMLVMLLAVALTQTDLFMCEILGEEHEPGYFGAAAATAHWVFLAQTTIIGVFAPLIAPAMGQGAAAARRIYWRAQASVTAAGLLLTLILIGLAPFLLSLFGAGFEVAATSLKLLTVAYFASSCAAPSSLWLQYSGKGATVAAIASCALAFDVAGNFLLIPRYGIDGAAAATLAAMLISGVATAVAMAKLGFSGGADGLAARS